MFGLKTKKRQNIDFDASEAFIDNKNLPEFDVDKFEGVLEKPLSKNIFIFLLIFFVLVSLFFVSKVFVMQILHGEEAFLRTQNNFIKKAVVFSNRGVVFDRNGKELIWNTKQDDEDFSKRKYIEQKGFAHILGFLSYPQKDKSNHFFEKEYVGKSGIEKYFNGILNGNLGYQILEVDSHGNIKSKNKQKEATSGKNIYLSIDFDTQNIMAQKLDEYIKKYHFVGGAGAMMDIRNGQILALVSLPEYDSNILVNGEKQKEINKYIIDKNKPFLNRATSGGFTPGSITKPFVAMEALKEKIINPNKKVFTNGKLIIPNKFHPSAPFIFRDYRNNGVLDMYSAIAKSSNIYFAMLGGGYKSQKAIGIVKLKKAFNDFSIGEKTEIQAMPENTGLVPDIEWKQKTFGQKWTFGNTYQTTIGQYAFLTTPIQMLVATAAIANNGEVLRPKLLKDEKKDLKRKLDFSDYAYKVVKKAMRQTVLAGTTRSLNFPFLKMATKSGTAQRGVGLKYINSWTIGFFPYDKPKYAFVFLAENGPRKTKMPVSRGAVAPFFQALKDQGVLDKILKY